MGWWLAVPVGIALGLALAVGLDRATEPAAGQGGRSGITLSTEQLRINQRIAQQGVKRANRANTRLDQLKPAATGPAGPAGPTGATGPAGPGAARIAFAAAVGAPAQTVLELAGVTFTASCETTGGGEAALALTFGLAQATTLVGTVSRDAGTDPSDPGPPELQNFEAPLPAGVNPVGGPSAPDGEYAREIVNVLFITPTRTISLDLVFFADGTADRCSFNGVAVPA